MRRLVASQSTGAASSARCRADPAAGCPQAEQLLFQFRIAALQIAHVGNCQSRIVVANLRSAADRFAKASAPLRPRGRSKPLVPPPTPGVGFGPRPTPRDSRRSSWYCCWSSSCLRCNSPCRCSESSVDSRSRSCDCRSSSTVCCNSEAVAVDVAAAASAELPTTSPGRQSVGRWLESCRSRRSSSSRAASSFSRAASNSAALSSHLGDFAFQPGGVGVDRGGSLFQSFALAFDLLLVLLPPLVEILRASASARRSPLRPRAAE